MKEKVLFITLHNLNGNGGGVYATRAYLNTFAQLYNQVSVLYPDNRLPIDSSVDTRIRLIPFRGKKSKLKGLASLLQGKPNRYSEILDDILRNNDFDLVVFDNSRASIGNIKLIKKYEIPFITIHHNFEYQYIADNEPLLKRLFQLPRIKGFEREAIQNSILNFSLTEDDKELFNGLFDSSKTLNPIEVIGTYEYKNSDISILPDKSNGSTFIITGSLNSPQTFNSLRIWINEYLPILKKIFSSAKLIIAGKKPSKELSELCISNDIELHANPKQMDMLLEKADFYICPTEFGGGMKLRIMDGLKYGLPVITHHISARGYEKMIDAGVMKSYATPQEFENALLYFKSNTISKEALQKLYVQIFSFQAGCNRVKHHLETYGLWEKR